MALFSIEENIEVEKVKLKEGVILTVGQNDIERMMVTDGWLFIESSKGINYYNLRTDEVIYFKMMTAETKRKIS